MKIKAGCDIHSDDFWYDLTAGGYLKPEEILEDEKDAEKVNNAIKVLQEFEQSCIDQIDDFYL